MHKFDPDGKLHDAAEIAELIPIFAALCVLALAAVVLITLLVRG